MSVGVMKDYKLKLRNLHASHTHWVGRNKSVWKTCLEQKSFFFPSSGHGLTCPSNDRTDWTLPSASMRQRALMSEPSMSFCVYLQLDKKKARAEGKQCHTKTMKSKKTS
jgi:hypothetical protein